MAEVPSRLALLSNTSQQSARSIASNAVRCKMCLLLGFRSSDRGLWLALRSRRLQVRIVSWILSEGHFPVPHRTVEGRLPTDAAGGVVQVRHQSPPRHHPVAGLK